MKFILKNITPIELQEAPAFVQLLHRHPDCVKYAKPNELESIKKEYAQYFESPSYHKRENQIQFFKESIRPVLSTHKEKIVSTTGKSIQTINSWETGKHTPNLDTILQLSELMGVPIN